MKKKLLAVLLTVLIVVTMIPMNALAASFNGYLTFVEMPQYGYSFSSSYPAPFSGVYRSYAGQFWFNGAPAYCVEFGKSTAGGMGYYSSYGWGGLSAGDQQMLNYVLMFGYNGATKYGGTVSQEYWATQVLIWQIIYGTINTGWENSINEVFMGSGSIAWTVYNYIKSNVYGFQTVPSFCSRINNSSTPTYELTYNAATGRYETTLYDSNGVLGSFNFGHSGYTMTRDGNTLTISTTTPQELVTVGSGKSLPNVSSGAVLFWTPSSGSYQTLASFVAGGGSDPVNAYFKLKLAAGNIEIVKDTEDGADKENIEFTVSGTNGLTRTVTTNADGYVMIPGLPAGITYTVTENADSHNVKYITDLPQSVAVQPGVTHRLDFYNRIKKGWIAVTKFEPSPEDESVKLPMQNVSFTVTNKETGEVVSTLTTDPNGYAVTPLLNYGTYTVTEQYVEGYTILDPFDVFIDTDGKVYSFLLENRVYECALKIVKQDAETGVTIPLAGTQFRIMDADGNWVSQTVTYPSETEIDVFETAQDGTLTLPELLTYGSYTLHEVVAPNGYMLHADPIPFEITALNYTELLVVTCSDYPAKGRIEIVKTGEMLSGFEVSETDYGTKYTPVYTEQSLAGAVFNVIADEDIVTPDGTLRTAAETVVATLTTINSANALTPELYLGRYRIEEASTVDGFFLDAIPRFVTLTYADQTTAIVLESQSVLNERQHINVTWRKDMELGTARTDKPFLNVVYGVFTRGEVSGTDGIVISTNSLIDLVTPDADGNCVVEAELPIGQYYLKELATAEGYIIDSTEYDFEFAYAGDDIPVIEIDITPETAMFNEIMRGSGKVVKTDMSGTMRLAKAKFELFTENGSSLGEYETNANGEIVVEGLSYGEYYVVETLAPNGFVLDTTQHHFNISQDDQVAEVIVKDTRPDIPNTGDQTNMALWVGLLWLSFVVLLSCGTTGLILSAKSKKNMQEDANDESEN